jgi:glutamate racemase
MKQTHFPIGVFDSGIGGLSILKALRAQLPQERFVYFADTAHNPYGEKSEAFVIERSLAITQQLIDEQGIKLLVVACNTATAAAIHVLRQSHPQLPIVGVEPAIKPAAQLSRTGRVGVLATRGTLLSAKFAALQESLRAQAEFVCVPCDGLAERIEHLADGTSMLLDATELIANYIDFIPGTSHFSSKNSAVDTSVDTPVDTLVLGCTHYPLLRDVFAQLAGPAMTIVDNAQPVALQTARLLQGLPQSAALRVSDGTKSADESADQLPPVLWQSSADVQALERAAKYWGLV